MIDIPTWTIGIGLGAVIALTAWRLAWLTRSGALAAWVAGTVAMGAGWDWGITLISYFVACSLLSRYRRVEKRRRTRGRLEKPGARDAAQVASNGGLFVIAALGDWVQPGEVWRIVGSGALATSAADTWATEIGLLASVVPRSIVSGERVPPGTSGGVSVAGTLAALGGAAFIAMHALALGWTMPVAGAALVGGFAGSMCDSVLGVTVQARYWCASCETDTERRVHDCGTVTELRGGARWLNNDGVNSLATVAGAAVSVGVTLAIR
ncbi:MAG: DUF92 domain-containing protein [Gemmatimonadaceae bacterium]